MSKLSTDSSQYKFQQTVKSKKLGKDADTNSSLRNVKSSVSARGVDFLNNTCNNIWHTSAEFSISSSTSSASRSLLYVRNHASTSCIMQASRTDSAHPNNSIIVQQEKFFDQIKSMANMYNCQKQCKCLYYSSLACELWLS